MAGTPFVDEAAITCSAGAGGNGVISWHREPYKPNGGPDGGDGGQGGSVILKADRSAATLSWLRDHAHIKAERGGHGKGDRRTGASGEDLVVLVPPGTVLYEDDVLIADLAREGDSFVAAKGGRGGRGNARFATPTRRTPDMAQSGEPGEAVSYRVELRLLADVGLVGFPNAGKSTLISRISAAKPKIADYPFTTLTPNLGVVSHEGSAFVVADIPGLIEGAHEGKGLGDRFLRHIRRAAVLVFCVDLAAQDRDPVDDVEVLSRELGAFDPELLERPSLIVATKMDVAREALPAVRAVYPEALAISAVAGEGLKELVPALAKLVADARAAAPEPVGYVRHVVREDPVRVEQEEGVWVVRGKRAERAVAAADLENPAAVEKLKQRLVAMGVERLLHEAGAHHGDDVIIGGIGFDFSPDETADPEGADV